MSLARVGLVVALSACTPSSSSHSSPPVIPAAGQPLFHFRVDFWSNLGQTLFHEAMLPRPGHFGPKSLAHVSVAPGSELSADELALWRPAVAYDDAHFDTRNGFDDDLERANRFLLASDSAAHLPRGGLPEDWWTVLERAAPVYRAHFWAAHQRDDHSYIERLEPRIAEHGAWMARRLSEV